VRFSFLSTALSFFPPPNLVLLLAQTPFFPFHYLGCIEGGRGSVGEERRGLQKPEDFGGSRWMFFNLIPLFWMRFRACS